MDWLASPDHWVVRLVFQRALGLIYLVAFLVALHQFRALLGERGILPIPRFVAAVPFRASPSLFHWRYSDRLYAAVAWSGVAVSAAAAAGVPDLLPTPIAMLLLPIEPPATDLPVWYGAIVLLVSGLVLVLSYRPARNLFSRDQLMNSSFEPLHLVNTYGAFGSVTKERYEVIVEGADEPAITPWTVWLEYEFKAKPDAVTRRPPQYAPYHLRLDWLMWFAAMSSPMYHEWFVPFITKLLEADPAVLRLLRHDPFGGKRPRFVRARLFLYRFTTPAERRATGAWWHRTYVSEYLRPVALRARA